eukprot:8724493-Pyramimonas_sp.AAC.1
MSGWRSLERVLARRRTASVAPITCANMNRNNGMTMPIVIPSYWSSPVAAVAPAAPRACTVAKTTFGIAAVESLAWPAVRPLVASPTSFSKTSILEPPRYFVPMPARLTA